mmetsp:Transcript_48883/g.147289  ORF Transcript_48883/g.147289 Transcript_48883/m.147289 type:complete len:241 (+) Transcript_48883:471-1193(+)
MKSPSIVSHSSGTGSFKAGILIGFALSATFDPGRYENRPLYERLAKIRYTAQRSVLVDPKKRMHSESRSTSAMKPQAKVRKPVYTLSWTSYRDKSIGELCPLHMRKVDSSGSYFSIHWWSTLLASPLLVPHPMIPNLTFPSTSAESSRSRTPCRISNKVPSPPRTTTPSYSSTSPISASSSGVSCFFSTFLDVLPFDTFDMSSLACPAYSVKTNLGSTPACSSIGLTVLLYKYFACLSPL